MEALPLDAVWIGAQVSACDNFFENSITIDMLPIWDAES